MGINGELVRNSNDDKTPSKKYKEAKSIMDYWTFPEYDPPVVAGLVTMELVMTQHCHKNVVWPMPHHE